MASKILLALVLLFFSYAVVAQVPAVPGTPKFDQKNCSSKIPTIRSTYSDLRPGKGFTFRLLTNKLSKPRGMVFDTAGNLLVVESGKGITALKLKDEGDICLSVASDPQVVISDRAVRGRGTQYPNCFRCYVLRKAFSKN
jgi:hypothetical protein